MGLSVITKINQLMTHSLKCILRVMWCCLCFTQASFSEEPVVVAEDKLETSAKADVEATIRSYEKNIDAMRLKYAVYDQELGQHLLGLGLAYQTNGNHKKAIRILRETHLINRINLGLQSPQHLKLIELLFESYWKLEDWEGVDKTLAHMHWIYRRNYEKHDPRWLALLRRLYRWHTQAYYLETDKYDVHHQGMARDMYDHSRAILIAVIGTDELTTCYLEESSQDKTCARAIARSLSYAEGD